MTLAPRTAPLAIRPAEERDVEAIQRVAREAWNQVYSGLFDAGERTRVLEHVFSRRSLREDIGRHSSFFYVADADGGVVGFAELVLEGTCGEVVRVAVLPQWQRRGIATALLRRGFEVLAAEGAESVTAAVEPEDEACRMLFERQGFEGTGDPLSDLDDLGPELAEYRRPLGGPASGTADAPSPEATVWVDLDGGAAARRDAPRGTMVLATADRSRLAFVESALEGAGIQYALHSLHPGPEAGRDADVVEVRVAPSRAEEARELLDTLEAEGDERAEEGG